MSAEAPPLDANQLRVEWGSHKPVSKASDFVRLRCALLNALTSRTTSTSSDSKRLLHLAVDVHEEGPYFTNEFKLCWLVEIPNSSQLFKSYGMGRACESGPISFRVFTTMREIENKSFYTIWAEAEARNIRNQRTKRVDHDGKEKFLTTTVIFNWPGSVEGDLVQKLDWSCIANLISHYAKIGFNTDGEPACDDIVMERLFENINPSKEQGYRS
ncbi:uncharacterized protein LY89DRAFT_741198 [Mollisia scopiformis]|uniref:Uncharacterized protein n=1 Tax=Mollisia scopiformis TaxID=149040 RepID=A0A132BAS4_MOLSC|nr:uncharacterized protein LY89DRAFT_741198 [Mollisia scopiformis]KUJ09491.1 hypothetical protein LY89DRAFT_741198 [Mollisia scopiformis]